MMTIACVSGIPVNDSLSIPNGGQSDPLFGEICFRRCNHRNNMSGKKGLPARSSVWSRAASVGVSTFAGGNGRIGHVGLLPSSGQYSTDMGTPGQCDDGLANHVAGR